MTVKSKKRNKALTQSPKILLKYRSGSPLLKKEEGRLWKWLVIQADTKTSIIVKKRDDKDGFIECITKNAPNCSKRVQTFSTQCNNCHRIPREYYSHRRNLDNCNAGCVSCNAFNKEMHKQEYDAVQIKKYGQEWYDKNRYGKNKIPPTIDELLGIIDCLDNFVEGKYVYNKWICGDI